MKHSFDNFTPIYIIDLSSMMRHTKIENNGHVGFDQKYFYMKFKYLDSQSLFNWMSNNPAVFIFFDIHFNANQDLGFLFIGKNWKYGWSIGLKTTRGISCRDSHSQIFDPKDSEWSTYVELLLQDEALFRYIYLPKSLMTNFQYEWLL